VNGDFYSGFLFENFLGKNLQYLKKGIYSMYEILFIKNKNKNDRNNESGG
jgi:hypothetical protein